VCGFLQEYVHSLGGGGAAELHAVQPLCAVAVGRVPAGRGGGQRGRPRAGEGAGGRRLRHHAARGTAGSVHRPDAPAHHRPRTLLPAGQLEQPRRRLDRQPVECGGAAAGDLPAGRSERAAGGACAGGAAVHLRPASLPRQVRGHRFGVAGGVQQRAAGLAGGGAAGLHRAGGGGRGGGGAGGAGAADELLPVPQQDRLHADGGHRPARAGAAGTAGLTGHLPAHRLAGGAVADGLPALQRHREGRLRRAAHRLRGRPRPPLPPHRQPVAHPRRGALLDVQVFPLRHPPGDAGGVGLRTGLPLPQQPPLRSHQRLPLKNIPPLVHRHPGVLASPRMQRPLRCAFLGKQLYIQNHFRKNLFRKTATLVYIL
jgi:hypothetical protein